MAVYKALPKAFAKIHPKHLTPSVSTLAFGGVSIVLYVMLNYTSNATSVIADCVSALGMMIAFYYGLTGFACAWYYRHNLTSSSVEMTAARPGVLCGSAVSSFTATALSQPQ